MGIFRRLWNSRFIILSLPSTIYFNLRYLPFRQAIKLPVILCMPRILGNGKYQIHGKISTGMIKLGIPTVSIYRRAGYVMENRGKVVFKGRAFLGAEGAISVGEHGVLTIGDNVNNYYGLKIICYHKVDIGNRVRFGWNNILNDSDFHSLISEDGKSRTKGFAPILIQDEVWIGSFCKIYKNSLIPWRCTVASNTLINKPIDCEPYSLIYSGGGIKVKKTGFYRNVDNDVINYSDK